MPEIKNINETTWTIEEPGVRIFLLEGTEKALLIDTGMNMPEAREIAETLTKKPLYLLNTHADRDHLSGNKAFDTCYMHPDEEENFRSSGITYDIIPVQDRDTLDLGDRKLEIFHIPGHTPGSIAIYDHSTQNLISGDSIQSGNIFMFGPQRNLDLFIQSMEKMMNFPYPIKDIYPSHGDCPVKPELIPEIKECAEAIRDGKAEGNNIDMFGRQVQLFKFPHVGFLRPVKE